MEKILRVVAICICWAMGSIHADVVFENDMESYSTGTAQTFVDNPGIYNTVGIFDDSTATPFGSGNQFMALYVTGSSFARINSVSELMTYCFDWYEPTTSQEGTLNFGIGSTDVSDTRSYTSWTIDDGVLGLGFNTSQSSGSLPTLSEDRHYTTYVVYNGSAGTESIAGSGGGDRRCRRDCPVLL